MSVSVADFYDGKSIFITGASGFIGKTLLEKLLYSCPGIDKVYILMRDKKKFTVPQRIQSFLEKPIFTRLREEKPSALQKIVPIKGDIVLKNLGLNSDDEKLLIDKVSIVFHLAATTRFNESIEDTFNMNVGGTERILNLCKRMKDIQKFVYVSTAYSQSERSVIEEKIYPAPVSWNEINKLLINGICDNQIRKLLNGKPNTYVFTKSVAEEFTNLNHGHVPSIIIRPSIVSSSVAEPIQGWIDNWAGASGFIISSLKGLNNLIFARPSHILDLIPVDYVVNLIIVAAIQKNDNIKDVPVFHSCSSKLNPLTLEMLASCLSSCVSGDENDYPRAGPSYTMSKSRVYLWTLLKQILPAHIADLVLHLRGKDKKYTKLLKKVLLIRKVLIPFTSHSWIICAKKAQALTNSLSESDKAIFPFNPEDIVWSEYIPTYIDGIQKYLIKP